MNTKKIILLSYDVYLFSGLKAWLPDLLLVDAQADITQRPQLPPQYPACLLIIDNRLPIFWVKKWLEHNSSLFVNMNSIVIRMNDTPCLNRGYETFVCINAKLSAKKIIKVLRQKVLNVEQNKSHPENNFLDAFYLTTFEKELLNASFTKESLHHFCRANAVALKTIYRYREKINHRFGFNSFNDSIIFLIRNDLLIDASVSDDAYSPDYDELNASRLSMAMLCQEIVPYYQPILNVQGEVCGVEILARWPQGHHYAISQREFIPLAINSGLMCELTNYLMTRVAKDFQSVQFNSNDALFVSFNIGPAGLRNPVIYWQCLHFMELTQELPIKLMIEITEDQALNFTPAIKELIRSLRNRGVLFALDDFGTGYANLNYLHELELDMIKIDKTFINVIKDSETPVPMLESIIHLANILGLRTVAEGVEHACQQQWLVKNNIHFLQGYYFLPPVPFADFMHYQHVPDRLPLHATGLAQVK
ncbi:EAL domain-containing protein [Citrobacter rodentium]|jgi:FOG: EAL domain|nr:EAL domain-containing protein [Citrobacter rodentium]QBY29379.1 EAL domain-containing protein [Citrobacter rodentium]UHO33219.1 EAL domain-containing protein [Citrobacter rodentium NBRC 105723 = DSM 16636]HAT8015146.1 EAL domain-containing protein [Citrobacter rodentium NBRC 105723 = DSM 16636]HAT8017485.1 EAL domain-containing protein [Citrobacter rodentium]HAT8029764.1 EAL domain-containing protein [Citrobacter rodentium]